MASKGKGRDKSKEIFTRVPLANDPETAKFLDVSEMIYPKIQMGGGTKAQSVAELESMWMVGFIDEEEQSGNSKTIQRLKNFLELPHGVVGPAARDALKDVYKKKEREERLNPPGHGALSEADQGRLDMLVRELQKKPSKEINQGRRAYETENVKIRKMRKYKRPTQKVEQVGSDHMNDLFELQRLHATSAITIQNQYRTFLARKFWKYYIMKVKAVVRIQRVARGMLVRQLLQVWYIQLCKKATLAQKQLRAVVLRRVLAQVQVHEQYCVVLIQKNIRRVMGKKRFWKAKYKQAAIRVQCLWRAIVGRARSSKVWMEIKVIKIERLIRGHLGRLRYNRESYQMTRAAQIVQRYFRVRVTAPSAPVVTDYTNTG
jgi:hypothetical protein